MRLPQLRWVVASDGCVGEVLDHLQAAAALEQGRVFIDGSRAHHRLAPVRQGQVLEVFAPRAATLLKAACAAESVRVLGERQGVLAVHKPALLPTEPDRQGSLCLKAVLADLIGEKPTRLHALSRLDVGVSGVLLVARTPAGRDWVQQARAQAALRRRYLAISCGVPQPECGVWDQPLPARGKTRGETVAAQTAFATAVQLSATSAGPLGLLGLLALEPITGRTHQLRVHCARAGVPLLGDRSYGGLSRIVGRDGSVQPLQRISLHAAWLELSDAKLGTWRVDDPPTDELCTVWALCGGSSADWEKAAQVPIAGH
jgi:23S rRNA-/tRNA-specific pseudouridylate synthase